MTSRVHRRRRLRDASLFTKVLVPFFVLLLVVGVAGAFVVVRDLSSRARAQLNQELLVHSLNARSIVHDRELYLLESVDFAANVDDMASTVRARDHRRATALLQSVLALKTDLNLLAVAAADGTTLVQFARSDPAGPAEPLSESWLTPETVQATLAAQGSARLARLVRVADESYLVVATPICAGGDECAPTGVAVAGMRVDLLVAEAAGTSAAGTDRAVVAVYDDRRELVAGSGPVAEGAAPVVESNGLLRRSGHAAGVEVASLYAPLVVQGATLGSLSATIPVGPSMAIASRAAVRLAVLLLVAMAAVVAIGVLLSRYVLAQVRPLVRTSRALGGGDLTARAPVVAQDELGELANVLNQMADQLQASHDTLERRVEERTKAIRELLTERTEFFTGISHELRTPVAVILSEAHMMLDPTYANPRQGAAAAEAIVRSAEQLLGRINEILDLARMESGRVDLAVADVSLADVVGDLAPTMAGLASAGGLTLDVDVPEDLPRVWADRSRLGDVVLNLVSNAVKYTPQNGTVTVAASAHNGTVELAVSDTGVGIPPDVGDRVFEPFYQVPDTRAQAGQPSSGLGLALARRLIEAQDGTIVYRSTPNDGTTFTIALRPAGKARRRRAGRSGGSVSPSGGR